MNDDWYKLLFTKNVDILGLTNVISTDHVLAIKSTNLMNWFSGC